MFLFIIVAVIYFTIIALVAEQKAPEEYNRKINTINELGCQTYERRNIMQWAYRGFGIILLVGLLYNFSNSAKELYYTIPVAFYSMFMILSGLFSSKPFEHLVFYSEKESKKNSLFLQLSALSLYLLIVMKFFMVAGLFNRVVNLSVFVLVIYMSARTAKGSKRRGLYNRVMYLISFLWFIYSYSRMMN